MSTIRIQHSATRTRTLMIMIRIQAPPLPGKRLGGVLRQVGVMMLMVNWYMDLLRGAFFPYTGQVIRR